VPFYETNVLWLLQGIVLMVPIIGGASLLFVFWTKSKALDTLRINFISSVSHELLTPLASLKLYIETMQMREIEEERRKKFLGLMIDDSERLAKMISKLLVASRIERKKAIYRFEETDLATFIGSFIKENDHLLKNAEISFTHEKGFPCNIDQESFDILLKNLFENAIRYSPTPASIAVSLKRVDHKVLLTVRDKGEGLEKKELCKIFEMFYRVPRKLRGTGLGLYIVKNIVSAHHGKIWAESEGPGKGSCFHVLLPALKNSMG
jgi:hypothetical protein